MVAEVDVVNIALTLLGEDRIGALTDPIKTARDASAIFSAVRDELMSRYNWTFAIKRGQATGAAANPLFGFGKAFDFPSDCLRIIRPGARYQGPDMTDYRLDAAEEFAIEGRQVLTDWPADGTVAPADSDKVARIDILTRGKDWTTQPTVAIAAPPAGVTATAAAYLGAYGTFPNVAFPGVGYVIWDDIAVEGGVPILANKAHVTPFHGSLRMDVSSPGKYSAVPGLAQIFAGNYSTGGCATSGGSGVNLQVDIYWRVVSIDVINPGSGYLVAPVVTVTNPASTGVGCTAVAVLGDPANSFLYIIYLRRVEDPNSWDPHFVKLMGAQLAMDLAEPITQSSAKRAAAENAFMRIMRDAVRNNAIQSPPKPLLDDSWMLSRL